MGTGRTSWMRPRTSALAIISDSTPPRARSSSRALPARRWPVETAMASASRGSAAGGGEEALAVAGQLGGRRRNEPDLHRGLSVPMRIGQALRHQLQDVGHPQLHVALPRRGLDVHQAARVVRRGHCAAGLGDGVQLTLREAARGARPLEAERAAEAAAVGDVRDVDHLVPGYLEQAPGLALEPKLAEALA